MQRNEFDVLVIGEGLSGITAAAAACAQGAHLMLASKGPGTFILGTACVDLDGLELALSGVNHCGRNEVEESIRFFLELTAAAGCAYEGGVQEHRLVPTIMGTFAQVSLAPRQLWKGDPRGVGRAVVVGIENVFAFNAKFVAERLSDHSKDRGIATLYRAAAIQLAPIGERRWLTPLDVAAEIDRNPSYREALVASLKRVAHDADLLILPGVLGLDSDDERMRCFEDDIGCAICELPTLPPSVPGLRLLRRLESHLAAKGAEICTGFSIQNLCLEGDHCTGAILDTPGKPRTVRAASVILASGKFSHLPGGGTAEAQSSAHGIVGEGLRAVNAQGAVLARNVFECGSVLGKFESRFGNAIAIVSGYQAGVLACRQGVQYARA